MMTKSRVDVRPVLMMVLLVIVVFAVPAVNAQEEPTPVPEPAAPEAPAEPATAEQTAAPEEPATPVEPAAPAAAAEPAEPTEPAVPAIPITYRQKTLIKVDGKAQANGVVEFVVQPQGGEPIKVRVNILKKSKPKAIADDLMKEFDFAIDDRYQVNRTGDKKFIVKAKKKNPPIAITIATQSLSGVSVTVSNG